MGRVVILNADDFGYEPRVTRGIVEAMTRGIVSSTTMMVNGPHAEDAAALAAGLAVGLHLNLARWRAVSEPARELKEAGAGALTADFVESEAHAQLDRLRALLGREATHVDVHKHLHRYAGVLEGLGRAAKVRGLPVRSVDVGMREALRAQGVATNDHFEGDAGPEAYWTLARLEAHLDALPADGVVELMCHPGFAPAAVQSGYSAQREVELATFTSTEARALLAERGVVLSSWSNLSLRSGERSAR